MTSLSESRHSYVPLKSSSLRFPMLRRTMVRPSASLQYKYNSVKVHSYIARYQVLGTAQRVQPFPPGKPVHSNAISTSLGSIQPCCNYCVKTIHSHIHLCLLVNQVRHSLSDQPMHVALIFLNSTKIYQLIHRSI